MTDDLKKLMEVAAKPLKTPIKKIEYSSTVYQFISENKIVSSEKDVILFSIVYLRYTKWCKNNNLKPKGRNMFASDFNKKFDKSSKRNAGYHISPEGFDLSPQNEQEALKFLQDVSSGSKKEKTKKG